MASALGERPRATLPRFLGQVALTLAAIAAAFPVVWMGLVALTPKDEIVRPDPLSLPSRLTTENFTELLGKAEEFPLARWLLNSLIVSSLSTVLVLLVASTAAYAFARLRFKGRDALFLFVVATLAIPSQVSLIPVFLIVQRLRLFDTYAGLVLPGLAGAFGVFLLRQFFASLPRELQEAAYIDGAGHTTVFWRVILPLAKAPLATLGIFSFIGSWNDFVWPLIVTSQVEMRTLPLGLSVFQGRYTIEYGITMAAAVLVTIPMAIAFLVFQRRIVEGVALTGLK